MGSVDYTKFAPPHSFIDVNDFASPKQLARYLSLLDQTDSLYMRYFDWKREFTVHLNLKLGWCLLCKLAHDSQVSSRTYEDILEWWVSNNPANCSNLPKNRNILTVSGIRDEMSLI
jgi:alpha-1,3-fucosyltransferase